MLPFVSCGSAASRSCASAAGRGASLCRSVRYYLVDLPPTASLRALVSLAHQRWTIEQQYQELKDEIGLDLFEGRSLPGWQRHVIFLTAIAYGFLQNERRRRGQTALTLPRPGNHPGSADRTLLHDATALSEVDAQAQRS